MGEDARAGGAGVTGEGGTGATGEGDTAATGEGAREPQEIRRDIESTREELGDTVAALAEKTDVKARARKKAADVKQSVTAKRTQLVEKARASSPDGASSAAATAQAKARENPMPIAIVGAFAAGLVVGRILKR